LGWAQSLIRPPQGTIQQSDQESVYLKLIGADLAVPLFWDAHCIEGTLHSGPCAGIFGFTLDNLALGLTFPIMPAMPDNASDGIVTATDLVTVTTPEPGVTSLLLLGIGSALATRRKRLPTGP
jgi:PEP-CTERM motif